MTGFKEPTSPLNARVTGVKQEMRRIYDEVEDHMECCKCELCARFRFLADQLERDKDVATDPS